MGTDNDNKNVTMDINDAIDNIFDDKASAGPKFQKKAEDTATQVVDAALTGEEGTTVLSEDILTRGYDSTFQGRAYGYGPERRAKASGRLSADERTYPAGRLPAG